MCVCECFIRVMVGGELAPQFSPAVPAVIMTPAGQGGWVNVSQLQEQTVPVIHTYTHRHTHILLLTAPPPLPVSFASLSLCLSISFFISLSSPLFKTTCECVHILATVLRLGQFYSYANTVGGSTSHTTNLPFSCRTFYDYKCIRTSRTSVVIFHSTLNS